MSHHGGHHGSHGHGNMISANIGDQVAAGGAGQMNARQRQYWDRWIQRGRFAGLWQFGLLIVLFLIVAAVPVVLDFYMAGMGQPDDAVSKQPASAQSAAGEETAAQPAAQYAPPAPQSTGAWSQTPGYESDFGHPNSSSN
ncbi:MAG: hypothetical protein U0105_13030 [Candidatus Obscuribacterales bacterium]